MLLLTLYCCAVRRSVVYLEEVEGVPTHELPHDGQRHLMVTVDDVQPSDVDHS